MSPKQTRWRARVAAGAAALLIGTVVPVVEAAPSSSLPRGATDITGTGEGKQLVEQAKQRFQAYGFSGELRAVKDEAGVSIVPADAELVATTVSLDNGKTATVVSPTTRPAPVGLANEAVGDGVVALAAPSWNFVLGDCFARINDTWSYMDHCYHIYRLGNDGDAAKDYYALQRFATMGPNPPWVINWAQIQAQKLNGTPAQTWLDWSPKADFNGNCNTIQLGVFGKGVALALNVDRCEHWDMTKQNPAIDYKLRWTNFGCREDRELAFEIAVTVAQGAWPQWVVPAEVHGGIV